MTRVALSHFATVDLAQRPWPIAHLPLVARDSLGHSPQASSSY